MATQNTMTVSTFKEVASKLPPNVSILLRANHGVGKSKVVRQVRALWHEKMDDKTEFPVIDRRLSQMTEGDMVGLPSTDGEVTRFNPPDWYRKACATPCVLFLDELNRATPEVMQAAFQIVLDRELNGWKLHPATRVVAAINNSAAYTVNEMDPALLDRFWTIDLAPTTEEFLAWARSEDEVHGGRLHNNVPDFIAMNDKWLYGPKNVEPGTVSPSPRSWEFVNNALVHAGVMEKPADPLFYSICLGFVGVEAAIAFKDFVQNNNSQLNPEDIIDNLTDKKILARVKKLPQTKQVELIDRVAEYSNKNIQKFTEEQGKNLKTFIKTLPDELKINLWTKMVDKGLEKIEMVKSLHKHVVEDLLAVFGVPVGEAGMGVVPNIPGIFKDKK